MENVIIITELLQTNPTKISLVSMKYVH